MLSVEGMIASGFYVVGMGIVISNGRERVIKTDKGVCESFWFQFRLIFSISQNVYWDSELTKVRNIGVLSEPMFIRGFISYRASVGAIAQIGGMLYCCRP